MTGLFHYPITSRMSVVVRLMMMALTVPLVIIALALISGAW
jgi:hypothetical protein